MVALTALLAAFSTSPSLAQTDDLPALTLEILDLHAATSRLDQLADAAANIAYIESVALLSFQGAWKDDKQNWPAEAESPFFYDVHKLSEYVGPVLMQVRRSVERDKTLAENERSDFRAIITDAEAMLDEARTFYDLLHAKKMDDANAFYRDRTRERYASIQSASYTLGLTLNDRIKKVGLKVRSAK